MSTQHKTQHNIKGKQYRVNKQYKSFFFASLQILTLSSLSQTSILTFHLDFGMNISYTCRAQKSLSSENCISLLLRLLPLQNISSWDKQLPSEQKRGTNHS